MQRNTHMSDETQKVVDEEIKRFVDDGYKTAQTVIRENIDDLHTIAQALIEYETLTGDEIRGLMDGKMPMRPEDSEPVQKSTGVPTAGASRAASAPTPTRAPRPSRSRAADRRQIEQVAVLRGGPFVCAVGQAATPVLPRAPHPGLLSSTSRTSAAIGGLTKRHQSVSYASSSALDCARHCGGHFMARKYFGTDGIRGLANGEQADPGPGDARRHGRRPQVRQRRPSQPRGDRQGYAPLRLHDRERAHRRLHRRGHGCLPARPDADARRRHAHPLAARRPRRHDLGLAQPVRRQRHQAVPPRRLQALRPARERDRRADGYRHPVAALDRPRHRPLPIATRRPRPATSNMPSAPCPRAST